MCLILFAIDQRPDLPLVVAANRDEFHQRPTAALHRWPDLPVVAGRDRQEGGTWLGTSRVAGVLRFAAVTNYREVPPQPVPPLSRGALVRDFLAGGPAPEQAMATVARDGDAYRGFNLLLVELGPEGSDGADAWYLCNRQGGPERLGAGVYGLANDSLDVPWPKVERGKAALARELDRDTPAQLEAACLTLLADSAPPPEHELRAQGLTSDMERRTSPVFIRHPDYGTRASSVVLGGPQGISLLEQGWGPEGRRSTRRRVLLAPPPSCSPGNA